MHPSDYPTVIQVLTNELETVRREFSAERIRLLTRLAESEQAHGCALQEALEWKAEVARLLDILEDIASYPWTYAAVRDKARAALRTPSASPACVVDVYQSRVCQRGTESCTVDHDRIKVDE